MVQRERTQQRTVDAPVPQVLEETVEVGRLDLHERVQQCSAEQIEDAPQFPAEVVEALTLVPLEQAQQRTAEKIGEVPETASQVRRLQRTVEQAFSGPTGETRRKVRGAGECVRSHLRNLDTV